MHQSRTFMAPIPTKRPVRKSAAPLKKGPVSKKPQSAVRRSRSSGAKGRTGVIATALAVALLAGGASWYLSGAQDIGSFATSIRDRLVAAVSNSTTTTIRLGDLLPSSSTTVINTKGQSLPRTQESIPLWQGQKDYTSGSITPIGQGYPYGASSAARAGSMVGVPPNINGDKAFVRFTPSIDTKQDFKLTGSFGIFSIAPAGTKTYVSIYSVVNGTRTQIYTKLVEAGQTYPVDIALSSWKGASKPSLEFVMEKYGPNSYNQGLIYDGFTLVGTTPTPVTVPTGPGSSGSVYLDSILQSPTVTVKNSAGTELPRKRADVPRQSNGNTNFNYGFMEQPAPISFGPNKGSGKHSFMTIPPNSNEKLIARFPVTNVLRLDKTWNLHGFVGLASNAPAGTKSNIAFYAEGKNPNGSVSRTLLYSITMEAGQMYTIDTSLASWNGKTEPVLEIVYEKYGSTNSYQAVVVSGMRFNPAKSSSPVIPPIPVPPIIEDLFKNKPVQSIARSNLAWADTNTQNQVINTVGSMEVGWYRDAIRGTVLAEKNAALYKRVQDTGKKILITVMVDVEDFANPSAATVYAGSAFNAKCGWPGGIQKLSMMDLDLMQKRLENNLNALKKAGVTVDAFEIGNELDWVCFNGDLPMDRPVEDSELLAHARAYGRFLARAEQVIHQSKYYPNAKIVSHGVANGPGITHPGMMKNPGKVIAMLKNVDGVNYQKHLDVLGIHVYMEPVAAKNAGAYVKDFKGDTGTSLPVWVTEWGFRQNQFSNPATGRYNAFKDFYQSVKNSNQKVDNMFYYALDSFGDGFAIVDGNYTLLPEGKFFAEVK